MRVLRAAEAETRVEAPGVIRRVLVPRFGADGFAGVGALRAVHLLTLDAGATLPARRLANLSVLRLCWRPDSDTVWLLRQDCGAGAELPAWSAPAALEGVEFWVQSRRSNGVAVRHESRVDLSGACLAAPGMPGWDAPVWIDLGSADAAATGASLCWAQVRWGSVEIGAFRLDAGDGLVPESGTTLPVAPAAAILCVRGG